LKAAEEVSASPAAGHRAVLLTRLTELLLGVRKLLLQRRDLSDELRDRAHIDDRPLGVSGAGEPARSSEADRARIVENA